MDGLEVTLRLFTYPYEAAMSICSDLDETPNRNTYLEIMRYLNTSEDTAMGPGVNLEVGNSIYFDMPQDQFAYWNTDDTGREMVRTLIQSGHIDCLHSFGDLAVKREHAARTLDELDRYGCKLEIWVDHGTAATNFGCDIMQGHGDEPGHEAYHADLTTSFGVKYIWRGRVTSIIGQNVTHSFGGLFKINHPAASGLTILKEAAKCLLARTGNQKYSIHGLNELMRPAVLRDNNKVYEFIRSNPHWGGVSSCDQGRHIGEVLTKDMLNRLIKRGGLCILYTHLGKIDNHHIPFSKPTKDAFLLLAEYHNSGRILLVTTHRLLRYLVTRDHLRYRTEKVQNVLRITIDAIDDPIKGAHLPSSEELQGITFEVDGIRPVELRLYGSPNNLNCKIESCGGKTFASIPWQPLVFPNI